MYNNNKSEVYSNLKLKTKMINTKTNTAASTGLAFKVEHPTKYSLPNVALTKGLGKEPAILSLNKIEHHYS